jgi:sialic acid synthase SpsE
MAIAFGPVMIEKRLTFDKTNKEHHHAQALEPDEMKEYVEKIRKVFQAVGKYGMFPSPADMEEGRWSLRRIVANRDIVAGETFSEENIECKLPQEGGLHPLYYSFVLGKIAKRDLKENEPIAKEDIG